MIAPHRSSQATEIWSRTVYMLRHLVLDHALRRILGHAQAPPARARPRPSGFHSLFDWMEAGFGTARSAPGARMRASDAEREEVTAFLRRHYAEGRIDDDELNARAEAAYRAVTVSDLERLTTDLPNEPAPPPVAPPARSRGITRPVVALAGLGLIGILALAAVSIVPAELWALLLMLVIPFGVLALFTILPLAIPALAAFLLTRGGSEPPRLGPSGHSHRVPTTPRDRGWVSVWRL